MIQTVHARKPDEANGGRIINGTLVGPSIKVDMTLSTETGKVYENRVEAIQVDREARIRTSFCRAMGLDIYLGKTLTVQDVLCLFVRNEEAVREVIADKTLNINVVLKDLDPELRRVKGGVKMEKVEVKPAAPTAPALTVLRDFASLPKKIA